MMIGWEKLPNIQDLIETQWNVNPLGIALLAALVYDLIETQWNVNFVEYTANSASASDLIETQWNVNKDFERDYIADKLI